MVTNGYGSPFSSRRRGERAGKGRTTSSSASETVVPIAGIVCSPPVNGVSTEGRLRTGMAVGCGMWDVGCGMWDVRCGRNRSGLDKRGYFRESRSNGLAERERARDCLRGLEAIARYAEHDFIIRRQAAGTGQCSSRGHGNTSGRLAEDSGRLRQQADALDDLEVIHGSGPSA